MKGALGQCSAHVCKYCLEPISKASPAQQKYDVIPFLAIWQLERQVGKRQQERDRGASPPCLSPNHSPNISGEQGAPMLSSST